MSNLNVKGFFDQDTYTISYVAFDEATKKCAIIDSVLDYDPKSGRTQTDSADQLITYVQEQNLSLEWIIETHVHADHLSAAPYLKEKLGGQMVIGFEITTVQNVFGKVFNAGSEFQRDGSQFDILMQDGQTLELGELTITAMHTPGHTPACMTYIVDDAAFVGDTIFMPDFGTARCDFPGGDAQILYNSIQKLFTLPDDTRVFLCHDYKAPGRDEYVWETTIGDEKQKNIHVGSGNSEADFVKMRSERDATLSMPVLILPSVQVNMRAGDMPPADDNGISYLKIPLNTL